MDLAGPTVTAGHVPTGKSPLTHITPLLEAGSSQGGTGCGNMTLPSEEGLRAELNEAQSV